MMHFDGGQARLRKLGMIVPAGFPGCARTSGLRRGDQGAPARASAAAAYLAAFTPGTLEASAIDRVPGAHQGLGDHRPPDRAARLPFARSRMPPGRPGPGRSRHSRIVNGAGGPRAGGQKLHEIVDGRIQEVGEQWRSRPP
jgi:hypothetical protein